MEMQFKNEIKKLADIVLWADNWITNLKIGLTEDEFAEDEEVKVFETVKKVVLESMERHAAYTSALNKDIADKAAKIELLEKEIEGRKEGYLALKEKYDHVAALEEGWYANAQELVETCKSKNEEIEKLKKESEKWQDLAKMNRDTISEQQEYIDRLNKDAKYWKEAFETQATSLAEVRKCNDDLVDTLNKSSDRVEELEKQVKFLEEELNKTCTTKELDLKGHNRREMALVNELADKNDEIKKLEESIDYYKNQERIRTDQLRATERKVEELHGSINRLTLNCRAKNTEIARLTKEHSDIRHELAKRTAELEFNGEDDHGRAGFKKYIEWLIEEEERAVPERFKERLNEEITEIFTKEEETEVKGNGRTSSGRYPWGAKVNGIPCGEDAIE